MRSDCRYPWYKPLEGGWKKTEHGVVLRKTETENVEWQFVTYEPCRGVIAFSWFNCGVWILWHVRDKSRVISTFLKFPDGRQQRPQKRKPLQSLRRQSVGQTLWRVQLRWMPRFLQKKHPKVSVNSSPNFLQCDRWNARIVFAGIFSGIWNTCARRAGDVWWTWPDATSARPAGSKNVCRLTWSGTVRKCLSNC